MKKYFSIGFLLLIFLGCAAVNEGARQVGKPIGATTKAMGSVTDGALEGYSDDQPDNPYGR